MAAPLPSLKPSDLPTPPKVALEVMRACSRDDCSNAHLGELAARDAGLTAEALRMVNSAWFGFGKEVRSVAHAAVILGQRALRNLVLCISVRDALKGTPIANFDRARFAEDALRRAVAARLLAPAAGLDRDEAFTAGLLQDFGLLVLFHVYPQRAPDWAGLCALDPERRLAREREHFPVGHDAMAAEVARQWELPDDLGTALGAHHAGEAGALTPLARVLRCADWLAAVYEVEQRSDCLARCRDVLGEILGADAAQVDEHLAALPGELRLAARDLGVAAREQPSFEELMRETNVALAEENLSYQELTLRLQSTLRERDRLAAELDRELEQAREIQRALLPAPGPADFPVAGVNVSAKQLSGDFYDFFPLPGGAVFFCLGDVSGKGANAAILMAKVASLLRCLARQMDDLSALVGLVNREIVETSARGMFVTLVCGIYDPADGGLRLVNAGHLPALLVGARVKPRLLAASAVPLGVLDEVEYQETRCRLDGGRLYLFSDGVTESEAGEAGAELGIKGLFALLQASWDEPAQQQLEGVVAQIHARVAEPGDDLTLLRLGAG